MGGQALAKDMGIDVKVLVDEHQKHYEAAKKMEKDPDGGSWPAYPSGKSWDDTSGKTGSGKKFYHNIIQGSDVKTQEFYVAIITPVIHYCMGGLEIDADSACVGADGKAIKGLYAAGEDATEEFNMIHPPDVIGKYAPDSVIGMLGAGGDEEDDDDDEDDDEEDVA